MRKAILIFSIIISALNANGLFSEFKTKIISINGNTAVVKNSNDIAIGSTGIVIHKFGDSTSSIVARVDVINKSGDKATLRFHVYKALKQSALPKPGIRPKVGDQVILNYLYDRALIVAPNYKVYNDVITHFKNITWVNPDIMAAYLAQEYRPNPDKTIFQKMCMQNSASLIFFALNNGGYFVDCNNFKVVKEVKSGSIKTAQLPFYTRVRGIDSSWLNFSSKEMGSYSNYYRALIKQ